ncbi:recombinase family protein [Paenibacillus xylanexedens]|uniref:recombinase family protein n=1 Tax=Paenibacillus xylanexedens TaxID=528191 RepID=UPI003CFF5601
MVITNQIAIYIRVSTQEQTNGYSIVAQLEELRAYAAKHSLIIYREYIDAGYSGKTINGRPALQELLSDATKKKFSTVITWKLNRLARNLIDQLKILSIFKQQNISYMSLTEKFDSSTPQGFFVLQMLGSIAELEREQIAENVRLGIQRRSQQGLWNSGNNVLRYEWTSGAGIESHVRVVPSEAELVRMIFEKYRDGDGLKSITSQLNAAGYITKRNRLFSIAGVRGILTNVNYIGYIRYTVRQKFSNEANGSKQITQGAQKPIISIELWNDVQKLLKYRSKPKTKSISRNYPLTGLLKCPLCGSGMVPARNRSILNNKSIKMNHYYVCGNYRNKGSSSCKANYIPATTIEDEIHHRLQQMLLEKTLLNQIVVRVNRLNRDTYEKQLKQLETTKIELRKLENQQRRCFELFEEGHIGHVHLNERLHALKNNINILGSHKQQAESKLSDIERNKASLKEILQAIKRLFQAYQLVDADKQKSLLRGFIKSIVIPQDRDVTGVQIYTTAVLKHLII